MTSSFLPRDRRVLLIPIDDSEDAEKSVFWTLQNLYRPGKQNGLPHVITSQNSSGRSGIRHFLYNVQPEWKSSATIILNVGGSDLLYFLHVVPERQFDIIGGDAAETIISEDEDAERRAVDHAKDFIKHRILEKIEDKNVPHQVEIVRFRNDSESVGTVISQRAATLNAAAVVMAKHRQGAIRAFFVGSATNFVANHCKQPVVVLH